MENLETQTLNEKKKFLKRYKRMTAIINRLEEKLARVDERMYKIKSPNFSSEPKGGTPVTMEDLLSEKMELEERINRLIKKSRVIRQEILDKIDELDDVRYGEVLEAFFIECKDFQQIADDTGYTVRHVIRLYSEGIRLMS